MATKKTTSGPDQLLVRAIAGAIREARAAIHDGDEESYLLGVNTVARKIADALYPHSAGATAFLRASRTR